MEQILKELVQELKTLNKSVSKIADYYNRENKKEQLLKEEYFGPKIGSTGDIK